MKYSYTYDSPAGKIYIAESGGAITDVMFRPIENSTEQETPLISRAIEMLREYFAGTRQEFDLPLNPAGTDFQKKAWNALLTIPYGQTRTYKEQAEAVGNPKASRAVGAANGKNPINIFIPCHRVIGADKTLTGYGGGLEVKKLLLELEGRYD
ncbi:MAG: methylated-DNA--[protein]-cysteine S-methyltransferase [Oscillospiraceae bacterium]|nr:methylated-DNA--[protein]-cysteine S-methyltransferase [Oscillospiraceae bacterium]